MKRTVLELVREILNGMDGLDVESISDSEESLQVAQIIKTTFYELCVRKEWRSFMKIRQLESVGDNARPNYLKLPERTQRVDYILYDTAKSTETRSRMTPMSYLYPDEYLVASSQMNTDSSNVTSVTDPTGIVTNCYNDRAPRRFTSLDDSYLIFDGFDSSIGATLVGSKSQASLYILPEWVEGDDDFIPELPAEAFPLLLAEAKNMAFFELRQMVHEKSEMVAQRHNNLMSQRGRSGGSLIRFPNYGRKSRTAPRRSNNWKFEKN